MSWATRFRIREQLKGSFWIVPLIGAAGAVLAAILVAYLDRHVEAPSLYRYSPDTASNVLTAVVGATAALAGFVITVTVLAVQMAAGTFSPRYMRLWYRDGLLKATLAVLVGTLTFALALLRRIEDDFVPDFGVTLAAFLVAVSLLLFLLFFDRFIHRLRPVAVAALVTETARRAFAEVVRLADRPDIRWDPAPKDAQPSLVVRASRAGSIQAVDPDGLVRWARNHGAELVFARPIGDFVPTGGALIRVYGGSFGDRAEAELRGMVALGEERTVEQDPTFAMRILVDIGSRALSPGINDPTTAVQVLNYLGEILGLVGATDLRERTQQAGDEPSAVVMRTRRWEDYLALGVTEIREYGATSVQVPRRLRALLEELHETVRPEHRAAVKEELARLDSTVSQCWGSSVDLDRASTSDNQGIGGPKPAVDVQKPAPDPAGSADVAGGLVRRRLGRLARRARR